MTGQVAEPLGIGPEEAARQLEHVLSSETFRKASSLRLLLQFLVTRTIEGNTEHLKESVIGIEVFGRRQDFDCRIDNIVRVQAHRLRKMLESYYAAEGKDDVIRFSLPKGCYVPRIEAAHVEPDVEERTEQAPPDASDAPVVEQISLPLAPRPVAATPRSQMLLHIAIAFLVGALSVAALVAGLNKWNASAPLAASQVEDVRQAPLSSIWQGVFAAGEKVVVSFTNPVFLRTSEAGLWLVYDGPLSAPTGARIELSADDPHVEAGLISKLGPVFFSDGWTGTGEVLAVRKLTEIALRSGSMLEVKRSRLLSTDDLRGSNVIFVGSPWGNPILARMWSDDLPFSCCRKPGVVNRYPKPGEPASYWLNQNKQTGEIFVSYGLFSVLPGLDGKHTLISSAGITTHTSWAAVNHFTSTAGVNQLVEHFRPEHHGRIPPYFQAIIRTQIINGEAGTSTLVTAREVSQKR